MNRRELLARANEIQSQGFTDESRREFDELLDQVEAFDAETPTAPTEAELRANWPAPPIGSEEYVPGGAPSAPAPAAPRPRADTTSLTGRRRLLAEQLDELEARGHFRGHVFVGGGVYGAAPLRTFLKTAATGHLQEIQEQLNAFEDAGFERDQRDAADRERDARLQAMRYPAPLTADEDAARLALLSEAREAAEAHEGNRLERIEGLLERIASGLGR